MKNLIVIDVDTNRQQQIMIKKPLESDEINNKGEMLSNDINCIFEAFCSLVKLISTNGHGKKNEILDVAIKHLESLKE